MRIQVIPLDFMGQAPLYEPRDKKLFDLAMDYCNRELAEPIDFVRLNKVWVAVGDPKFDKAGNLVDGHVCGLTGYVLKPDIPVFRVSGENAARATKMLTDRYHDFFADQGLRGQEIFIHISGKEKPEQRCPRWEESLSATDAKPADRFSVIVR